MIDHIYWTKASSKEIYKRSAEGLVKSTLDGINATIFAYGQTSSGKTHTMFGGDQQPGIIPLGIRDLFESVEQVCVSIVLSAECGLTKLWVTCRIPTGNTYSGYRIWKYTMNLSQIC